MVIRNSEEGRKFIGQRSERKALDERRAGHRVTADTATLKFLQTLHHIDKTRITNRDVLVLFVVCQCPGICGKDIADRLNVRVAANIQKGIQRLIERGMIEDRRVEKSSAVPQILHPLPPGFDFLETIRFWEPLRFKPDPFWEKFIG